MESSLMSAAFPRFASFPSPPKSHSMDTQEEGITFLHDPNYDYYSIDNILEEDALLKVKTLSSIPHASCLRESDENGVIPAETEIELPGWIAIPLLRNHYVELVEPKQFSSQFLYSVLSFFTGRTQLWAEPTAVNIRFKCPSFYELGSRYAQLTQNPSLLILLLRCVLILQIMCRTYLDRSQMISRVANSKFDKDNTDMLLRLTE